MSRKTDSAKSPASFPRFHPHVTLTSIPSDRTDAESTLRSAILSSQQKIPIQFRSVDVGDKYYMSVYVSVHHSVELETLREHLRKAVGEDSVPPLAHVSLFYVDNADAGERERIRDILQSEGRIIEKGPDSVALDTTEGDERGREVIDGFVGGEIWIALCDGPVETWIVKDKISLR